MSEAAKPALREILLHILKGLALAAVLATLAWLGNKTWKLQWSNVPIIERPWFLAPLLYLSMMAVLTATARLWSILSLSRIRSLNAPNQGRVLLRVLLSFLLPIPFATGMALLLSPGQSQDLGITRIFKQASDLGHVFITTFATGGETNYEFIDETPARGPHGYARITLRTYGETVTYNAGWVFYFVRGADISDKKQLRFFIRGETGSERLGIKMKDAQGREVAILLDGRYLPEGRITTAWQEASIPLTHFGNVNLSVMDNLTLLTVGSTAATLPQTVYVGEFSLLESCGMQGQSC